MIQKAYRCKSGQVRYGYCEELQEGDLKALSKHPGSREDIELAEDVLKYFHITCAPALAGFSEGERVQFLGNLDCGVANSVLSKPENKRHDALCAEGVKWRKKLATMMAKLTPNCAFTCPGAVWATEKAATAASQQAHSKAASTVVEQALLATPIRWETDGTSTTTQDEETKRKPSREHLDFAEWAENDETKQAIMEEVAQSIVHSAMLRCLGRSD